MKLPVAMSLRGLDLWLHGYRSATRLRLHQARKLRQIVRHAYHHVPFYRRLYDEVGLHPDDISGPEVLRHLPIVRREDIQSAPAEDLLARGVDRETCVVRRSGGSTGRPLTIVTRREDLAYETLGWLRTWFRLGLKPTDLQVTIKDLEYLTNGNDVRWFQRLGLLRVKYLSQYEPLSRLVQTLVRLRPDVLRAAPSNLKALAREIEFMSADPGIGPRLVFTTSETLTPSTRAQLQGIFRAPVFDLYGATEAGCIAWQCPKCSSYHVNSDYVVLEVIDHGEPVGPGQTGEVVVTNLFSCAMPFIRYSLGDVCELQENNSCEGTRGSPTIRRLLGRTLDQITLANGRIVPPDAFTLDSIDGIVEYQVIHERIDPDTDLLRFRLVRSKALRMEVLEAERREYEAWLGQHCRISIEFVESIPLDPAEKFRRVVSKVATESGSAS